MNLAPALRQAVSRVDPLLPLYDVQTMSEVLSQSMEGRKFNTLLLALLGLTGLVLASIGIYGVIAFLVSQRTHEIAVRMALGATAGNVTRLVVGKAAILALLGLALGGTAAFWSTRVLNTMLFEVRLTDPVAYVGSAAVLIGVALLAALLPALRAARVEPLRSLSFT
jgi:ABC-type antimicrobial peptide transport system permease subunit